jgi:hypothetical protein
MQLSKMIASYIFSFTGEFRNGRILSNAYNNEPEIFQQNSPSACRNTNVCHLRQFGRILRTIAIHGNWKVSRMLRRN